MKSIRSKIMISTIFLLAVSLVVVCTVSIVLSYNSTMKMLDETLTETAHVSAERVSYELKQYKSIATEIGCVARLSSVSTTLSQKQALIDACVQRHGLVRGNVLSAFGKSIFDGKDYSDRDYFKVAMTGVPYVSEPIVSQVTGELTVIVAAPLWENGIYGTKVVGVVYMIPVETFLNDIMTTIEVSDNAIAYMINKSGTTIADVQLETVKAGENIIVASESDKTLKAQAAIMSKMINGEQGVAKYTENGVRKIVAYAQVQGTDGWSVGIESPMSDFTGGTIMAIIISIVLMLVALAIAAVIAIRVAGKIANPITVCVGRLSTLAEGDIHTDAPKINANDETGALADATEKIIVTLGSIIRDISDVLEAMAAGDLTHHTSADFPGDLAEIKKAFVKILSSLNSTMLQIDIASSEVSMGADQVSSGAQALSQGATEQAASVEELSATIADISTQIKETSENAKLAGVLSSQAGEGVVECNTQMENMMKAMNEIAETSDKISKIIKTIDDIAFQTNILALNAAVEAARAGQAGKGFAVVADEVRNLAGKSAAAAKDTTALIESSIAAVENGNKIAAATAKSLKAVVGKASDVDGKIQDIATASEMQANAVMQVTQGIDQISSVVQTNSATAEESAAASEELSGQSQMLQELIDAFELEKEEMVFSPDKANKSVAAAQDVMVDSQFKDSTSDKY